MWSDLKMIYSKLQDEESTFIFMKRLQYSLGNQDMERMYEMVTRKEGNGQHSLYTLLKERGYYSKEQPIIIFGAGFGGKVYKPFIEGYKVGTLVAFCDNDRQLQGTICEGLPVLSVEEANRQEPTALFILSNAKYSEEMKGQLLGLGVGQERIFCSVSYEPIYGSQYFERDIIRRHTGGEVFIDGGSFDLADTIHFIDEYPKFRKVYAFEPDSSNYIK